MTTKLASRVFEIVEAKVRSTPSSMEFEMAYQIRVAIDRIRFAIKQAEQPPLTPEQTAEITLQLLDALDRLESADRDFQTEFHDRSLIHGVDRRERLRDAKAVGGR